MMTTTTERGGLRTSTRIGVCRRMVVVFGLFVGVLATPVTAAPASAASTIYVSPTGDDSAAGTEAAPVRTLRNAVWRAHSGDAIVLRGGVYHENVQIHGKAVAISSAPGERAVFDGAVALDGWQRSGNDWFVDGWTPQFPQERSALVAEDNTVAGYPDLVFIDGRPLRQVLLRSLVEPGTFFHDTARDRLYVGDDPAGRRVEASSLPWGLYFNDADGSSLENVTIRRYATPSKDVAALRVYSDDIVVRGVTSELNAAAGVSAIGNDIVVAFGRFVDNGHLGIHAHQSDTLVIEGNTVVGNNKAGFDARHSAGGIKVTTSTGVTIRRNDVSRNGGPGIWTDLDAHRVTISYNRVQGNARSGIEVELSSDVDIVSNVSLDNGEAGIWVLESQDVEVFQNATYQNVPEMYVLEGPRRHVSNVVVENNVFGDSRGGGALVVVDDWTRQRAAAQMDVRLDYNAYWQPSTSKVASASEWGEWPVRSSRNATLADHQVETGQDANSVSSTADENPFWSNPDRGDYRPPLSIERGAEVTGGLASELRVRPGSRPRIGPMAATPSRITPTR